jgi:hypothetical protein
MVTTARAAASDSSATGTSPSTASRAAGTGCAQLLAGLTLDEWGYPVVTDDRVEAGEGRHLANTAVRLCPAQALYLR